MGLPVLQLVNQALQTLGLPQAETITSAQDDQTGFQMLGLLNELGTQLTRAHDWQGLERTQEYIGDGSRAAFDLPDDYGRMVNQTQWSSKNLCPMRGPISPQGWSWIQFGVVVSGFISRYRILNNQFLVFPTPAVNERINFYYISKDWVRSGSGTPKQLIDDDSDTVEFDDYLMICGIKYKLWAAKGLDATALGQEFEFMLSSQKAQTQGAPVISLDRTGSAYLIGIQNLPEGDWNA